MKPCGLDETAATCLLCRALGQTDSALCEVPRPVRVVPCVHLGRLVERAHCDCPRLDQRRCDRLGLVVRQADECEGCAAYEADGPSA